MKKIRIPNLFLVGEPRCGTTTLYKSLNQHPDIFFCKPKEPNHFAKSYFSEIKKYHNSSLNSLILRELIFEDKNKYLALFNQRKEKFLGDASTRYLYSRNAAHEIFKFNPDAKIIALFREPIDFLRSYHSQQLFLLNEEVSDLSQALNLEKDRKMGKNLPKSAYLPTSLYYSERIKFSDHLKRYIMYFPNDQIKVIIFEDFIKNNQKTLKDIFRFLNIETNVLPVVQKSNANKLVKNRHVRGFFQSSLLALFVKRIIPINISVKIGNLLDQLTTIEKPKKKLNEDIISKLKIRFTSEVHELNRILHKNNLIDFDLMKLWQY